MTTTNTKATRMTKEEREALRLEKQKTPAFTNMKVRVNSKNELVVTIPLAEFEHDKLVNGGLSKVEEKYGVTKNGNVLLGASYDYISVEKPGYEHVKFNMSAVSSNRDIKQEIADNAKKAEMKALADSVPSKPSNSVDMDYAEYQEFLAFKKWKAEFEQQNKQ